MEEKAKNELTGKKIVRVKNRVNRKYKVEHIAAEEEEDDDDDDFATTIRVRLTSIFGNCNFSV